MCANMKVNIKVTFSLNKYDRKYNIVITLRRRKSTNDVNQFCRIIFGPNLLNRMKSVITDPHKIGRHILNTPHPIFF